MYSLKKNNDSIRLEILSNKEIKGTLIFIFSIIIFFVLLFSITLILLFINYLEFGFGILISWSILWFVIIYMCRLYLWNKYGKEVFIVTSNYIETYYDFKYFKDNRRSFEFSKISLSYLDEESILHSLNYSETFSKTEKNEEGKLYFKLDNENLTSHKYLSIKEILKIGKALNCDKN